MNREPRGHKRIQVKRNSNRKYVAACPIGGCRESRTMDTEELAWQAMAAHIGAAHEIHAYLH